MDEVLITVIILSRVSDLITDLEATTKPHLIDAETVFEKLLT